MRVERDSLGERQLPDNIYYGIHTLRAVENFPLSEYKIPAEFIVAFAEVKLAAAKTNSELGYLPSEKAEPIIKACEELISGNFHQCIVVDPFQGGAGTSTNMNFNEVIANIALEKAGRKKGDYGFIHPLHHVNMHQSTNDVYPTAVKLAILRELKRLESEVTLLQDAFQKNEFEFKDIVKLGRTELQDAVPMTLGMEFGAYAEAIARDRWRIFKSRERIKVVNLGGTAIGTGLGAAKDYILKVTENLRKITGLNLARAENLVDATQNLDSYVEVFGMLKAYAVNLFKISNDLRLLSSGPEGGIGEIILPPVQSGSSIMPGKINPVIPEAVGQIALKIMGNETIVSNIASSGNLELNQFYPLLAFTFLESLKLLLNITVIFREKCVKGIKANKEKILNNLGKSKTIATVLVPLLGYEKVEEIIKKAERGNFSIEEILKKENILSEEEIKNLLNPKRMHKLGYTKDELKRD